MGETWSEKSVFLRALELPPLERSAFLDSVCPTAEAKSRIEALLARAAAERGLLGRPSRAKGAAAPSASGALGAASPLRVDEFEFIRELGRGGMGVVYLARDVTLGRLTAVKVLVPHLVDSEQAVERFKLEGRAVAALNHPGIVPVYRAACSNGRHYIAMEYVEGETLHDRIRAVRPSAGDTTPTGELPAIFRDMALVRDAARLVASVAEALDHAHRNGVVHRDVKPSNVLVDSHGQPHLTDFGIAKVEGGPGLTTPGDLAGTAHYMSPEQVEQVPEAIDHRSDIFSLGVVLYELLSLRRPFDAPAPRRVMDAIRHDEPAGIDTANALVPTDLAVICHKALEKRPQNRYQTAAHLAADLRAFLAGDPILARPPSAVRRLRRWARRHRTGIATAAMVALVAVAAFAVTGMVLAQRGRQGSIELAATVGPGKALLRRMSDDGFELAEPISIGSPPVRRSIDLGIYRVAVMGEGGRFAEATVPILAAGQVEKLHIEPTRLAPPGDEMVLIPGGTFLCGVEGRAAPNGPRPVRIAPFHIDRTEVSNAEYWRFVQATGARAPEYWRNLELDPSTDMRPVVAISWAEAEAYARWIGKRLPTAAEWECAMRGAEGRLQPWGQAPMTLAPPTLDAVLQAGSGAREMAERQYAMHVETVESRPELASPEGILHAASNVMEWTASIVTGPTTVVITRGASWADDPSYIDLATVRTFPLETLDVAQTTVPAYSMKLGFRCARSAAP